MNEVEIIEAIPVSKKCKVACSTMAAKFAKLNNFTVGMGSKWRNIKMINCGLIFITYITSTYMAAFQDHPLFLVIFNSLAELFFYFEVRALDITRPVKHFLQNRDT